jgi:hypothetical protein
MKDGVYKLTKDSKLPFNIQFNAGQEIEIVLGVVYIGGHLLQPEMQMTIFNWLSQNSDILKNVTKNW